MMRRTGLAGEATKISASHARTSPVHMACLLLVLTLSGAAATVSPDIRDSTNAAIAVSDSRAPFIFSSDGSQTATFSPRTDDAALLAAIPALIARGVQSVNLRGVPIRDITPLAKMTGLRELNLCGTLIRDVAPLAGLIGLRSLNLQFVRITDLRPLSNMHDLRTLNLGGTDVRDLTPLGSLSNLRDLTLAVTKVSDLSGLRPLTHLISLDLGSTEISDLRPLSRLSLLRSLNLNGTTVSDIRALGGMTNLRRLDLGGTQVSDLRPLAQLRELTSLNVEGTPVSDLGPLSGLTGLRSLAYGGSLVRDTGPVAGLTAGIPVPQADDPVLDWIYQTNQAIQTTSADPFLASRVLVMESIAVLDTIRSIEGAPAFLVRLPPPPDISMATAVATAAHTILNHFFPARRATLDAALAASLAREPDGPLRAQAVAFGKAVAMGVIAVRDQDGASDPGTSLTSAEVGQWRPTAPDFIPAAQSQWARLTPFAMTRPDQFRPAGPPMPGSTSYRVAKARVIALGGVKAPERNPEQTETAHYWADETGSYTPPGHWNAIAMLVAARLRPGLSAQADLFAALNIALADAGIAVADAKYTWWFWRPITAIRTGGDGGTPVPDWTPLLETPGHPSYMSGHATFSGAAATVLTARLGVIPFTSARAGVPGAARSFSGFDQAAEEAAASRLYGGIHFPFDNADGLAAGRAIGAWTIAVLARGMEDRGPFLMVEPANETASNGMRTVIGCALNNIAPVTTVTAQVDDGESIPLKVDAFGWFTLPRHIIAAPGRHKVTLAAISATGRGKVIQIATEDDTMSEMEPVQVR